jgi:membrane protease YdiL (CAAX protease family)
MYLVFSMAWGWVMIRTGSLKMAILVHVLSNLFYTVVGFAGWDILAYATVYLADRRGAVMGFPAPMRSQHSAVLL